MGVFTGSFLSFFFFLGSPCVLVISTLSSRYVRAPLPYRLVNAGLFDYKKKKKKKNQHESVFKAYQPNSTLVDTQAAFLRQDPRVELKDRLLSAGLLRDTQSPVALSKEQKQTVRQEIEQQPVYISAREELGLLKGKLIAQYGTHGYLKKASDDERRLYRKHSSGIENIRRAAEKAKLNTLREEFFSNVCNLEIRKQLQDTDTAGGDGVPNPTTNSETLPIPFDSVLRGERVEMLLKLMQGDLQLEADQTGKCIYCEKRGFSDKYTLKRHVWGHLRKMGDPGCGKCKVKFLSLECLQLHLLEDHAIET